MRAVSLEPDGIEGVRWYPEERVGVGVLVLAGSSGRVDSPRARVFAGRGVVAESVRWFGGPGQHAGPWEIPLELFFDRVASLRRECERVFVVGTSFGGEATLLVGAHCPGVDGVVAFAGSDVVWAGVREDGTMTSHWTLGGSPLPYVPFDESWEPEDEVPAFVGLYESSRAKFPDRVEAARIPVERIKRLVLVAGGDDQVWAAVPMAESIQARRAAQGRETVLVTDPRAGHRTILPGEPVATGGIRMRRGGSETADRRLGEAAWKRILDLL